MTLPRHVNWAKPEPKYNGIYDYDYSKDVVIGAGGLVDFEIPAGKTNGIYLLTTSTISAVAYQIEVYDRDSRTSADLVFRSVSKAGNYNSVEEEDDLILQVDKDGDSQVYVRVTGSAGEAYTLNFRLVRWI